VVIDGLTGLVFQLELDWPPVFFGCTVARSIVYPFEELTTTALRWLLVKALKRAGIEEHLN
jgi:hypothetical protein